MPAEPVPLFQGRTAPPTPHAALPKLSTSALVKPARTDIVGPDRPAGNSLRAQAARCRVLPDEIDAGARRPLAQARGHQLAETRKQLGLGQKQIAAAMGVSVARVSQIEHGEVTSFEVIARYVNPIVNGHWESGWVA